MEKQISKVTVVVTSVTLVLTPFVSFGHDGEVHAATTTPASTAGFCSKVNDLITTVGNNFNDRVGKYETNKADVAKRVTDNRTKHDQSLASDRAAWDQNRSDRYAKLYEKATTTEEKAAVDTFKTAMEKAVTERRSAVDAAIKKFRDGVNKAVGDRQTAVAAAQNTLQTAVSDALKKASDDCAAGKNQATVRTATMTSLKNARTAFATSIKSLDKVNTTLKTLSTTRNAEIKKAMTDFKTARDKAVTDLKAAFPKESSTATTTPAS